MVACSLPHKQFITYYKQNIGNWDFILGKITHDKIIRIAFDRYLSHVSITVTKYYD